MSRNSGHELRQLGAKLQSAFSKEAMKTFMETFLDKLKTTKLDKKGKFNKRVIESLNLLADLGKQYKKDVGGQFFLVSSIISQAMEPRFDPDVAHCAWSTFIKLFLCFEGPRSGEILVEQWMDVMKVAFVFSKDAQRDCRESAMKRLESALSQLSDTAGNIEVYKAWWKLILKCICYCYTKKNCPDNEFFVEFHMKVLETLRKEMNAVFEKSASWDLNGLLVYEGLRLVDKLMKGDVYVENVLWFYDRAFKIQVMSPSGPLENVRDFESQEMLFGDDPAQWNSSMNLAYYRGILHSDTTQILKSIKGQLGPGKFGDILFILKPGLEIVRQLALNAKKLTEKALKLTAVAKLFFHLLRIRVIVDVLFDLANQDSFPLMVYLNWRLVSLNRDADPFVLSLYFAIIHDHDNVTEQEITEFFKNLIGLVKQYNPAKLGDLELSFARLVSNLTASVSGCLLKLNSDEVASLYENPVVFLNQMVPKAQIYLAEIQRANKDSHDWSVCYNMDCNRWKTEGPAKAMKLLANIIASDNLLSHVMKGSIVNTLLYIYRATGEVGEVKFLWETFIPQFMAVLCKGGFNGALLWTGYRVMLFGQRLGISMERLGLDWVVALSKIFQSPEPTPLLYRVATMSCSRNFPHVTVIAKLIHDAMPPSHHHAHTLWASLYCSGFSPRDESTTEGSEQEQKREFTRSNMTRWLLANAGVSSQKNMDTLILLMLIYDLVVQDRCYELVGKSILRLLKNKVENRSESFWYLLSMCTHYFGVFAKKSLFSAIVPVIREQFSSPSLTESKVRAMCLLLFHVIVKSRKGGLYKDCFEALKRACDEVPEPLRRIPTSFSYLAMIQLKSRSDIVCFDDDWKRWSVKHGSYCIAMQGNPNRATMGVSNKFSSNIYTVSAVGESKLETVLKENVTNRRHLLYDLFMSEDDKEVAPETITESDTFPMSQAPRRRSIDVITVVYMQSAKMSRKEMLKTDWKDTSLDFRNFLMALGVPVDASAYTGVPFKKSFRLKKDNDMFFYSYDEKDIVVYKVLPLMKGTDEEDKISKRWEFLSWSPVAIVWLPIGGRFNINEFHDSRLWAVILVQPVWNGALRISVKQKRSKHGHAKLDLGLLSGWLIVAKEMVFVVIHWLVLNIASHSVEFMEALSQKSRVPDGRAMSRPQSQSCLSQLTRDVSKV